MVDRRRVGHVGVRDDSEVDERLQTAIDRGAVDAGMPFPDASGDGVRVQVRPVGERLQDRAPGRCDAFALSSHGRDRGVDLSSGLRLHEPMVSAAVRDTPGIHRTPGCHSLLAGSTMTLLPSNWRDGKRCA